jgi:outer membrane autotransporter protein
MALKNGLAITTFLALLSTSSLSLACDSVFFDECLDGVGPAVTSSDSLRISSSQISKSLKEREDADKNDASAQLNGMTGKSAGDSFGRWSVWGSYAGTDFDADIALTNALDGLGNPVPAAIYDGDTHNLLIGADTLIGSRFIVGVALGYENTDITTEYNGGDNESDAYSITPYAAYLINDIFSIDVSAGYTSLDYDTDRIDNTNGNTIRGDFDSDRWFVASNLNAVINKGNWYFAGRVGYLYTEEDQDDYTETGGPTARTIDDRHIDLTQFVVGLDVSYNFGMFEPYAIISYLNDINRDEGADAGGLPGGVDASVDDDDEVQSGIGLRLYDDGVSGTLEWTKVIGRDSFDSDTIMFTLRADI